MSPPPSSPAGRALKRLLGGLVASVLLLPVPVLALTFTSSWSAVLSQSGGPTPPAPTYTDVTDNAHQVDYLFVNMGDYKGASAKATSTIELTRAVSIAAPGQTVEFEHVLLAGFQNAGANITAGVKDSAGHTVITPIRLNLNNPSNNRQFFLAFEENFSRLKSGNYTLDVQVQYFTNNKMGAWKSVSAFHAFEFEGQ